MLTLAPCLLRTPTGTMTLGVTTLPAARTWSATGTVEQYSIGLAGLGCLAGGPASKQTILTRRSILGSVYPSLRESWERTAWIFKTKIKCSRQLITVTDRRTEIATSWAPDGANKVYFLAADMVILVLCHQLRGIRGITLNQNAVVGRWVVFNTIFNKLSIFYI